MARWESRKLRLMAQSLIYGPDTFGAVAAKLHQAALFHKGHNIVGETGEKGKKCQTRSRWPKGLKRCKDTHKILQRNSTFSTLSLSLFAEEKK